LRDRMVSGEWAPGDRLPTSRDLAVRFNSSQSTVQRVLARLVEEGFLETRRRAGTFVTENPPHITDFALVFPGELKAIEAPNWSKYDQRMAQTASLFSSQSSGFIHTYVGTSPWNEWHGTDSRQRLHQDVLARRLAGVIFTTMPGFLMDESVLGDTVTPKVAVMPYSVEGVPAIALDQESLGQRAMQHLAQRGRKRVASIQMLMYEDQVLRQYSIDRILQHAHQAGLTSSSSRIQFVHPQATAAAQSIVELLMDLPQDQRPDALLVGDDNITEAVVAGLMTSGVRVGEDLDVVAHANFPLPPDEKLPLIQAGFDTRQILATAIDHVRLQRAGASAVNKPITVPAVFAHELEKEPRSLLAGVHA